MKKITLAIMSLAAALASVSVADAQDAIDAIRQAKESRMESGRDLAPAPQIINVEGRKITRLDGLWRVIVDPFENGYYNYRYLILARVQDGRRVRYILGVPGHYYSNEKYMASMFGFPHFVLSKKQPVQDGRFGYWYTDIRMENQDG